MTMNEQKDFFRVEKLTGTIIAGAILWFAINFLLYSLGAFATGSWFMPRYFIFLLTINVIIGAGAAIALFNVEKE